MWRVAVMPSITGIRTSITTTSGRCLPGDRHRLGPVSRFADHLQVGVSIDDHPEPVAEERLVLRQQYVDHGATVVTEFHPGMEIVRPWGGSARRPLSLPSPACQSD